VAVVGGAQVTIIAIEFFADDADAAIAAAVVLLALAQVPVRKPHIVADTRFIVAINRAAVPVILTVGTKVLTARAVDADVSAAARRAVRLRGVIAPVSNVVRIASDWSAGSGIVGSARTSGARVAVTAVAARTLIPAPHRAQRPERQQEQHKAEQPPHKPPPRFSKRR
jgi:hypothetical protein